MSEDQYSSRGHHPTAITGGGHPETVEKGWVPDGDVAGHQSTASTEMPTKGPTTPSGVSSAYGDTIQRPDDY